MKREMSLTIARNIAGTLSFPSKMPGTAYGLPVAACRMGAALAQVVAGTACSMCYAAKDHMSWSNPLKAQNRRLAGITHPGWVGAMVRLLSHTHSKAMIKVDLGHTGVRLKKRGGSRYQWNEPGFHRWHDSGDIQSVAHLGKICAVAALTPQIRHWLPTLEIGIVEAYRNVGGIVPENLIIRISSPMLDTPKLRSGMPISSVFTGTPPQDAHECPARHQDHKCGSCRACWSKEVPHVAYPVH
jgi:hypothetical protein